MKACHSEEASFGQDSFLDLVTNMVGIIIILVLVVGMRVKNTPVKVDPNAKIKAVAAELDDAKTSEQSVVRDITKLSGQVEQVLGETMARDQQRNMLATAVAAAEHKIQSRRNELGAVARQQFDTGRELTQARTELDQLHRERVAVENMPAKPVLVENYPTPLGKVVDGDELHFQLRAGQIAFVPVDKLVLAARSQILARVDDLVRRRDLQESSDAVGPIGGFRLRYTVERFEETVRTPQGMARQGGVKLKRWSVIPVSGQLGETIDEALTDGSEFRHIITDARRRGEATATIWVYEDSFDSFRRIRKELYRLGVPTAARPLPADVMISGSPQGTKSATE